MPGSMQPDEPGCGVVCRLMVLPRPTRGRALPPLGVAQQTRQVLRLPDSGVDDLALALHPAFGSQGRPAERMPRCCCCSKSDGQTTRLATPASSSTVMDRTLSAEPGRWRASTMPGMATHCPSRAVARSPQGRIPRVRMSSRGKGSGWRRRLKPVLR